MRDPAGDISVADVLEDDGTEEGGELRAIFYDRRTKLIERLAKKQAAAKRAAARKAREYAPRPQRAIYQGTHRPKVAVEGMCKTCRIRPLKEGCRFKCATCAGSEKRRRGRLQADGFCRCGQAKPAPGGVTCMPCRTRQVQIARDSRARRKAAK